MGSFFHNLIVERGAPDALKRDMERALKAQGFVPAGEEENADISFSVLGGAEERFWVLVGDGLEEILADFARRLAKAGKRRVIGTQCVDSDVLLLSLTKGGAESVVCVGTPEIYDIEPGPFRAAPWKELVGAENWEAFDAARKRKYVFAEDALSEIGGLVGFRAENAVLISDDLDDDQVPLFTCAFRRKVVVPEFLPDEMPPAFQVLTRSMRGNPVSVSFISAGGAGRGLAVYLTPNLFDADACEIRKVWLSWNCYAPRKRRDVEGTPTRCEFADGSKGWEVVFPDADIMAGPNPERPDYRMKKGDDRRWERTYVVYFVLRGGDFSPRLKIGTWKAEDLKNEPSVVVRLVPLENRSGAVTARVSLCRADEQTDDWERQWMKKED